ncbi:MAG: hypothetical protein D6743_02260 [Calditrichaeota bacterium]|nr:MAG: hypothetical protein D6743_02260 [Calditrichota bacterium]
MEVTIPQIEKMNLVGFFLRDLLRQNLTSKRAQAAAKRLKGAVLFRASGMEISLVFTERAVEIHSGKTEKTRATISGTLPSLLDVALGENYLKSLLTGKIQIRGNILLLLSLLKLLRRRGAARESG